jgi:hypothetical protein
MKRFCGDLKSLYIRERWISIREVCRKHYSVDVRESEIAARTSVCKFKIWIENSSIAFAIEEISGHSKKDITGLENYISNVFNFDENYLSYVVVLGSADKTNVLMGNILKTSK